MWLKLIAVWLSVVVIASAASIDNPRKLYRTSDDFETIRPFNDPIDGIAYRLPNNTTPLRYDVHLSTNVHSGNFNFDGRVTIQIQALENTPTITLHYRQITITNVDLLASNGAVIQNNVPWAVRESVEFLIITPQTALVLQQLYSIVITYTGILRNDDAGFYRSSYIDANGVTKWLATTQFESTDARHAFPCYDEPAIRSIYSIAIRHDNSYNAISNMPEASRVDETGTSYTLTTFADTPSIQSYLIAFVVSDFTSVSENSHSVEQRVYAKPESIARGEATLALEVSGKILDQFASYLEFPYSLPKMDQAAMPNFAAGAMENWGLVTYREPYLLFNEATGTTRDRENIVATISHEFAHQWFGNLVSPAWWSYLWLNEGFATLYENHMTALAFPGERWDDTFLIDTVQPVFESDASPTVRAMTYYVENPDRIDRLFDNVAYSKSGSVLKMFQHAFGTSTWKKGLNNYLINRQLNYGIPDHLYQGIQTAVDVDYAGSSVPNVATIMRSWELQSGFPYIHVTRSNLSLTFAQNRFMYANRTSENLWWVPISYVVGTNLNFTSTTADFWMANERSMTLQSSSAPKAFAENDLIIVNTQQSAFYRVNYDETLWNLIIEQLNRNGTSYSQVHLLNRAQLIDDSFHLARAGLLNYDTTMRIMNYLEKETDYIPWSSTNRANTLLARWLSGSSSYPDYLNFMAKNVEALYNRLGVQIRNNEPRVDRYARTVAINIACQSQLESCLTQTTNQLERMLFNRVAIVPDLITPIYCNGIRGANSTTFAAMKDMLVQSTVQSVRNAVITGLGCTQDQELLSSYLSFAVNTTSVLTTAERSRILLSPINMGEASLRTMMIFVKANAQAIASFGLLSNVYSNIASRISTEELYTEFVLTLAAAGDLLTANQILTHTASSRTIVDWQAANLGYFTSFFNSQSTTTLGASNIVLSIFVLAASLTLKYLL